MSVRDAELLFACRSCGADVGDPCVTYKPEYLEPGRRAAFSHADRWAQVRAVLDLTGYTEILDENRTARWGMYRLVEMLRDIIQTHIDQRADTDSKWLARQLDAILTKGDPNR